MSFKVIKIVDKHKTELVEEAKGELIGAGFTINYEGNAEILGVDAVKHGGSEQTYEDAVILIGEK